MIRRTFLFPNFTIICPHRYISISSNCRGKWVTDWRNKPKVLRISDARKQEPNYFESEALKLQPGPGYIDRLCEIWFDKMSAQQDVTLKSADRLIGKDAAKPEGYLPTVDETQPRIEYENVAALKNAPESIKKIFSIKYGERDDLVNKWEATILDQVRRHPLDNDSLEVQIGKLTVGIRQRNHLLSTEPRRPRFICKKMRELIEERRILLTQLRDRDAASFNAILEKLKIAYLVPPLPEDDPGDERKSWVQHIIQRKVEAIKEDRLEQLRQSLVEKRKRFESEKGAKLAALDEEEKRLRKELEELDHSEDEQGLSNIRPVGEYKGHVIDCISEINANEWMYRPPPTRKPIPMGSELKKRFR